MKIKSIHTQKKRSDKQDFLWNMDMEENAHIKVFFTLPRFIKKKKKSSKQQQENLM